MIAPGTEMKVKPTADMPAIFHGMRVKVLRQSQHTSGLTVEVLEKRGCYRIGDQLHVAPYDVEPAGGPSHDDLVIALREIAGGMHHYLMDGKGTHTKTCPPCIAARALGEK